MSAINLRLPDSLHQRVRELAKRDNVSINQFISTALAEKMAALMTEEYLQQRAQRGRRAKYDQVLRKVKDRPADPDDL